MAPSTSKVGGPRSRSERRDAPSGAARDPGTHRSAVEPDDSLASTSNRARSTVSSRGVLFVDRDADEHVSEPGGERRGLKAAVDTFHLESNGDVRVDHPLKDRAGVRVRVKTVRSAGGSRRRVELQTTLGEQDENEDGEEATPLTQDNSPTSPVDELAGDSPDVRIRRDDAVHAVNTEDDEESRHSHSRASSGTSSIGLRTMHTTIKVR